MASEDPFGFSGGPDGPYVDGFAVTPSNSADFTTLASALWVATAQTTLAIVTQKGTVLDMGPVPAGTLLRIRVKRVNSTGTAPGTGIVALI